ncbi:RDD family protein [Carboxylicivirga marina]|uniref:RDD family protein n=1 Tax=Carboxylicivirga marina TaxID=2800988 RepID=A0ABS1HI39_9BACT|nr:RDD family protein [Carboxylicivirga marina]MBK3517344.1 RDD family protein [Carboxylicivirga marina]
MNRQERLRYCKACTHQKFDTHKGIICSLTNNPAEFEVSCTTYKEDPELKHKAEMDAIRNQLYVQEVDKGKRFVNYIIDTIFMYLMILFFATIYGIYLAAVNPNALDGLEENGGLIENLVFILLSIIYYTLMESLTGRTIGKLLTKTKVVDEDGNKPSFGTAFIRSLCRIVPFDGLSFLFAGKGWHDAWSNTTVVEVK